jgi:hypothetical protein
MPGRRPDLADAYSGPKAGETRTGRAARRTSRVREKSRVPHLLALPRRSGRPTETQMARYAPACVARAPGASVRLLVSLLSSASRRGAGSLAPSFARPRGRLPLACRHPT